jgi:hypothetical protein
MHESERHATCCGAHKFDLPVSSATFPEATSDFYLELCIFVSHAIKRRTLCPQAREAQHGPLPSPGVHYLRKPIVAESFGKRVIKTEDQLNFLLCCPC